MLLPLDILWKGEKFWCTACDPLTEFWRSKRTQRQHMEALKHKTRIATLKVNGESTKGATMRDVFERYQEENPSPSKIQVAREAYAAKNRQESSFSTKQQAGRMPFRQIQVQQNTQFELNGERTVFSAGCMDDNDEIRGNSRGKALPAYLDPDVNFWDEAHGFQGDLDPETCNWTETQESDDIADQVNRFMDQSNDSGNPWSPYANRSVRTHHSHGLSTQALY
jgi:hypothetical protein